LDAKFCVACGDPMAGGRTCHECGSSVPAGAKFCTSCGASMVPEVDMGPGYVTAGEWNKAPGEFVRRVSLGEMKGAFDRVAEEGGLLDGVLGRFAGVGRQVVEQVQGKSIVVPPGSIAAVMVDGVVTDVLPPGRQTTVGWFRGLAERLKEQGNLGDNWKEQLFTVGSTAVEELGGGLVDRSCFYLIDRRPIPVPFVMEVAGQHPGQRLTVQVLCQANIAGSEQDKPALSTFLANAVGGRDSLKARDLHRMLLAEVERVSRDALARHVGPQGTDYGRAEASITQVLEGGPGAQYGLRFDVTVAPRSTLIHIDMQLGSAPTPTLRVCTSPGCDQTLRPGQSFCTACGDPQPPEQVPNRACTSCGDIVPATMKFCTSCGTPFTDPPPEHGNLFTMDGQQLELDLILQAQGDQEVSDTTSIVAALQGAAARLTRRMAFEDLATCTGFEQLARKLRVDAERAVSALGLRFVELVVIDVRSKSGEWLLAARADMERARQEVLVGREWLTVENDQLDLQEMTLDLVLRQRQLQQDHAFELRSAEMDLAFRSDERDIQDRQRRQDLADASAEMDVADAQRDSRRDIQVDAAQRERDRRLAAEGHTDQLADLGRQSEVSGVQNQMQRDQAGHEMQMEADAASHDERLARQAMGLQSDQNRLKTDDTAYAARSANQVELDRQQGLQDLDMARRQGLQDLDLSAEDARWKRDRSDKDAERQHEKDEWAQMLQAQQAIADQNRAAEQDKQAHAQAMRSQLQGMSADEMIAAQAGELASQEHGAAFAQSLAQMNDGKAAVAAADAENQRRMNEQQQQLYERMLAEQRANSQASDQRSDNQSAQTMQLMQQMLQMQQANMATMAGVQQQSNAQTIAAHQASADQARSGADHAMSMMSNVAQQAATGPQQVSHHTYGQPQPGYAPPPQAPAPAPQAAPPPQPAAPAPAPPQQAAPAPQPSTPAPPPQQAAPAPQPPSQAPPSEPKATEAKLCWKCNAPLMPPYRFCGECAARQ